MKRLLFAAVALAFMAGLQPQPAYAQPYGSQPYGWNAWNSFWAWWSHGRDPRLTTVSMGVGAAAAVTSYVMVKKHGNPPTRHFSYGAAYGVTTFGCMVVYPMVATVVINRPLTPREAYVGMADCAVPFIGGWIVDSILPHDAWTDGLPQRTARR